MIVYRTSRLRWVVAALAGVTLVIHYMVGGKLSGLLAHVTIAAVVAVELWELRPRKWVE